ncbi:MAG TPA: histidine ammonia-lyase [Burkholderiales bacterium]|nr:histidine ammonia-lyase [Burkholderiales bacterium]
MSGAAIVLGDAPLTLPELRRIALEGPPVALAPRARPAVVASAQVVRSIAAGEAAVYGINTGIGKLALKRIAPSELERLQRNIVLSHAAGVGPALPEAVVRLVLVLKAACLAQGYSGVRPEVIDALLACYNRGLLPYVPAKGSVGASGDLAPLAHLAGVLIGEGEATLGSKRMPAREALREIGLTPLQLGPKEGVSLINGTQVSAALGLAGLFAIEDVYAAAVCGGALSVDAAAGSDTPFDERLSAVRGQPAQREVAARYRELLAGSEIRESHRTGDERVQDPYCLRCQPQVMGACLAQLRYASQVLEIEANAVSDNPLVFAATQEVLSGGNFHGEAVALAADALAVAVAEIGSMSERRTALLIDASLSRLPAFLVRESGLNSGFMLPQVTAAALASENKQLAHPASVDSIPTSANQEDFVSMATHAARRLSDMAENAAAIVAIELMAAAQGIDLRAPLRTSAPLQELHARLRREVRFYDQDRCFAPDIAAAARLVAGGEFRRWVGGLLPSDSRS